tara:strand:+ start:946 stop:1161 length:216 start_codon:yes stop_codon:yes gene_type:complete
MIDTDRLTEGEKDYNKAIADKSLTYEEGRLQGMQDMRRLIWSELTIKTETAIDDAIQEQETVVKEMKEMVE